MQVFAKLANLRQFKAKKDQQLEVQIDVQRILKAVQSLKYKSDELNINQKQFITLCRMGRAILLRQPSLLRLNGPIFIATGTVGYFKDLKSIISRCGHPDLHSYLFLGDYIGRGPRNIECLVLLICLKLKLEHNFFLLRGCHDSIAMARSFNFYDECVQRFSPKAFAQACQFLCSLPFAAIVQNQIFCCHAGIGPSLKSVQQINKITRPLQTPEVGLVCDLIWADPSYKDDSLIWQHSERGFSYAFHQKVVDQFLKQNKYSMICRGHEVVYDGFYMNRQRTVATICSLADYGGIFNNSAAIMVLNPQFQVYFKVIKQRQNFPIQTFFQENASSLLKRVIGQKRQIRKKQRKERQQRQKSIQSDKKQEHQQDQERQQDQNEEDEQKKHDDKIKIKKEAQLKQIKQEEGENQEQNSTKKSSQKGLGIQLPNKLEKDEIKKIVPIQQHDYEQQQIKQKQDDQEIEQRLKKLKASQLKLQVVYINQRQDAANSASSDTGSLDEDKL